MNFTGRSEFVLGHKIHEREDTFWQDDTGKLFDYRHGKLYRQDAPGKWTWIRQAYNSNAEPSRARPLQQGNVREFKW